MVNSVIEGDSILSDQFEGFTAKLLAIRQKGPSLLADEIVMALKEDRRRR